MSSQPTDPKPFLDDPTLPEPIRRALGAGMPLERLELDEEGRFFHQGEPFLNENVARLFHRSLKRTAGGTWLIEIPPFSYPLRVADTAYVVRSIEFRGEAPPRLTLSDETSEPLDPTSLRYVEGRGLYCQVKQGKEPARFTRAAYFAASEHIDESADGTYVLRLGTTAIRVPVHRTATSAD